MTRKYLIVGGVAGGASTAARLRRLDEKAEIIMFERGEYISFANCGLPYYIGGTITEREKLFVQTPEAFKSRFNVDVRIFSEVISIDRKAKTVKVQNRKTDEFYDQSYDKLILSPGALPFIPKIKGYGDTNKVFSLRTVPDTDKMKSFIDEKSPENAVVVGGGFIGIETAENLHDVGLNVTIVELANQVMNVIDYDQACMIHNHLNDKGIGLILKDSVVEIKDDSSGLKVILASGKEIETDMIVMSIGVKPENKLAVDAGLEVGERGGIVVNEYMQTNDKDIYALGDAIEVLNPIIDKKMMIPLAGPANKQGRILANNLVFDNKSKFKGTIGTSIAKVFDLTVGTTGVNEKTLKRFNIPYLKSTTHTNSNAGYYPGAHTVSIKLLFAPKTGKILGGQVIGIEGVDKRIDVIASIIHFNGTVGDLKDIEHAYAPPYSSAKDPFTIAGLAADNILKGVVQPIYWDDIEKLDLEQSFLLDVRTEHEVELGTIKGSVNIPVDELRDRLDEIPEDKKIVVFCAVGLRGYVACRILMQNGFNDVVNLSGGYKTYKCITFEDGYIATGGCDNYNCSDPKLAQKKTLK